MSTCYVNCEKFGFIKEQIYDIDQDSEELVSKIMAMSPEEQDSNLKDILGDWPNTYTFTKSMGERTLKKLRRPDLPMIILRPSIIIGALSEPLPGWTDTFSAAGALSLATSLGLVRYLNGGGNNVADIVPVDFVVNGIITSAALLANKPKLTIIHSSTGHSNPISWVNYMINALEWVKNNPFDQQVFKPKYLEFIPNRKLYTLKFNLAHEVPTKVMDVLSKVPGIGSAKMRKDVERLKKLNIRAWELGNTFVHFINHEWIFETNEIYELLA